MTKISSAMLSVGTLLRHAEDTGTRVSVLVQGSWMSGTVLGCDSHGAVLDAGESQFLVRLEQVSAVEFQRARMESDFASSTARAHGGDNGPIEAGPVTVPPQPRGERYFLNPAQH